MEQIFPALIQHPHRSVVDQSSTKAPHSVVEPPTIHYSELPDSKTDSPLCQEWNSYRRQVARLLAEGHEGRFILIMGETIIGIWDTYDEAKAVAVEKYLMQPCLIHQVALP